MRPSNRPSAAAPTRRSSAPFAGALIVILATASALEAQTRGIRFNRISREQGLAQSTVTCILQDRAGFMWLGTRDGLNRFDGYDFVVYKHDTKDPSSLPASSILTLLEDPSGDLWIGTEGGGLARWHHSSDTFSRYQHDLEDPESLSGNRVRTLLRDRSGVLWVGTFDSGLNRFDPETGVFERFRHDPDDPMSLAGDSIRALAQDRLGNLWVGTLNGLNHHDPATRSFTRFQHAPDRRGSLADDRVLSILEDRSGQLWIGTYGGLHRMLRASGTFERFAHAPSDPTSLGDDFVRVLFEDREGRLWLGTDGGLNLMQSDGGTFLRYRHRPADPTSLSGDRVESIFQDQSGVLWIGTWAAGVNTWNPLTWSFRHYRSDPSDPSGLTADAVLAFSEDGDGDLWIGTHGGGLNRLDRDTDRFEAFRHDPRNPASPSGDRITALLHDRDGTLWIGTRASGLNRFDASRGTFVRYRHDPASPQSLGSDGVMSLYQDHEGDLWIGTFGGGLSRLAGPRPSSSTSFGHFRHSPLDPRSLSNNRVSSLAEDSAGELWIGTFGGGVNRLDPRTGTFLRFQHDPDRPESLSHDVVTALHLGPSGVLWIGTQGGGLNRLDRLHVGAETAAFSNYTERDGLPSQVIWGILSEGDEALWLSTNNGLVRFDPRAGMFKSYDESHGLQSNEFNFGAAFASARGELFFGGVNGFNAFFPERIETRSVAPPVVLTSFLKFGQPVALGTPLHELDRIELDYRDHVFSFEFAALDYTAPHRNRYAYRLEGLTEGWIDWIELGTHRRVTFTGLDPGSYVLQVKAANHDGVWNEDGVSLAVTIQPPPWRSNWAYTLYALAATGSAVLVFQAGRKRRRRRRVLQEAREAARAAETESRIKGEFLANMSHEIRTPMSGVIGMTELLLLSDLTDKQREQLETIRVSGEALLDILNDILDYSKIESMKLELEEAPFDLRGLVEEALTLMAPAAANKGLDLGYWIDAGTPETVIGDSVRTRQVLINLMSNGVKFTKRGGVIVEVSARAAGEGRYELHFAVADSGIGIPPDRLKRLFKPFSQVDASTTRQYGGTGLGLAICKRLSELMGGTIWVDSTPDVGSTFHFTITGETRERPERAFLYRSDPHLAGRRVLIVDDNPAMQALLSRQTDAWGMLSEAVGSAAAALERLQQSADVDLAIMDRELVQRDEVSWVKGWGRDGRYRAVPVVLLTPLAKNGGSTSSAPGMTEHPELNQPVKPAQLFDVLTELAAIRPKERAATAQGAARPVEPSPPALRILLAEDNPVNQVVAPAMLDQLGYRADLATNGLEVLEALEQQPYDLVLMDVQMPEMDGFEATRRIHQRFPAAERPTIIAMTAHAIRGYHERCQEAGMDDYISKPIKIAALQAVLERVAKARASGSLSDLGEEKQRRDG